MHLQERGRAARLPRRGRLPQFQPIALPPRTPKDGGDPKLCRGWESGRGMSAAPTPLSCLFAIFFF